MPSNLLDPFRKSPGAAPKNKWDKVFVQSKHGGLGRAWPKPEDTGVEVDEAPLESVPETPAPAKPEIRLFNPQWGSKQGFFNRKIRVSVDGVLPPESAHLTRVTFTVSSMRPNGKLDRIESQDAHLDGGKASAEVTLWTPEYRDDQGKPLPECEFIFKAKHRDGKEVVSAPLMAKNRKDLAHRVRLSGMLFDANKCFLLPGALGGIRKIVAMHKRYPKAQALLVGHAGSDEDLAGSDIAFERAQMLAAFLKGKPNAWLNQFGPGRNARSRWGTRELQLMLSALPEGGSPYYSGNASGVTDASTTAALKAFQQASNAEKGAALPTDGKGDAETRKALVEAYMGLNGTTLGDDVTPIAHGVEGHVGNAEAAAGPEADDRRLEAFFFEEAIMPQPSATTSSGGSSPYPKWLENLVDTEDFGNHGIHVQIVDAKKRPVPLAIVRLNGPITAESKSDEHGFVSFTGLVKGEYTLASELNGYKIGVSRLKYPTAKTVPGHVKTGAKG